jgi:PAS domain S-box-containing protein
MRSDVANLLLIQHSATYVCAALVISLTSSFLTFKSLKFAIFVYPKSMGFWLGMAALSVGFGVWSTHFVAILGYRPDVILGFDPFYTFAPVVLAPFIIGGGVIFGASGTSRLRALAGGVLAGLAITALHYGGMLALTGCSQTFNLSIAVMVTSLCCALSAAAILVFQASKGEDIAVSAFLFSLGVVILHFGAMYGTTIFPLSLPDNPLIYLTRQDVSLAAVATSTTIIVSLLTMSHLHSRDDVQLRRLGVVAEHTGDMIIIGSATEQLIWVNRAFEQATGHKLTDVRGRKIGDFLATEESSKAAVAAMRALLENGEPAMAELAISRRDGASLWVELDIRPVFNARSQVELLIGSMRDITYRRMHESELNTINAALTEAKEAAETANSLKSEFLAIISHEMRTPLNSVLGMAQMLELTELGERQKSYIEDIKISGDLLLRLINDVLDLSQISAGRMALRPQPFDLHKLAREVVAGFRCMTANKGITVSLTIGGDLRRWVSGDPERVRQMLTNLVGNAVKFTDKGGVRVLVAPGHNGGVEGGGVRLEVSDTGPGIAASDHKLIFERFRQVDSSVTSRHGGTGLGLAITQSLATMMGGSIGVESELGKGALFWLELPLPAACLEKEQSPEAQQYVRSRSSAA